MNQEKQKNHPAPGKRKIQKDKIVEEEKENAKKNEHAFNFEKELEKVNIPIPLTELAK